MDQKYTACIYPGGVDDTSEGCEREAEEGEKKRKLSNYHVLDSCGAANVFIQSYVCQ
jgi:hypothetical protein